MYPAVPQNFKKIFHVTTVSWLSYSKQYLKDCHHASFLQQDRGFHFDVPEAITGLFPVPLGLARRMRRLVWFVPENINGRRFLTTCRSWYFGKLNLFKDKVRSSRIPASQNATTKAFFDPCHSILWVRDSRISTWSQNGTAIQEDASPLTLSHTCRPPQCDTPIPKVDLQVWFSACCVPSTQHPSCHSKWSPGLQSHQRACHLPRECWRVTTKIVLVSARNDFPTSMFELKLMIDQNVQLHLVTCSEF